MIDAGSRGGWLAGVDGCRAGWVAAFVRAAGDEVRAALASEASGQRGNSIVRAHSASEDAHKRAGDTRPEPGSSARVRVVSRFADVLAAPEAPAVVAVDIPVGLPERTGYGGRAAENAVRPLLGARQSSVFSVPSRAALAAEDYREACRIALETSDPPRKISKQLYMIAPKIREVDACLRAEGAAGRVFEVHPEVAFWRLNGARSLDEPKKIKGRCYEPGLALRRRLLIDAGMQPRRSMPSRRKAPVLTISWMPWPAPRSRAAFTSARRGRFPTRPSATGSDCRWRSGRKPRSLVSRRLGRVLHETQHARTFEALGLA